MSDRLAKWPEAEEDREHLASEDPLTTEARHAWERLYDFARSALSAESRDESLADEVAGNLVGRLFALRERFDLKRSVKPIEEVRKFVAAAARNELRDRVADRNRSRPEAELDLVPDTTVDPTIAVDERLDLVSAISDWLEQGRARERLLARLRRDEPPAISELAAESNEDPSAVRRSLLRLLQSLGGAVAPSDWRPRDDRRRLRSILQALSGLTESDWRELLE